MPRKAAPLTERPSVVVISDWVEGSPAAAGAESAADRGTVSSAPRWRQLSERERPWQVERDGTDGSPEVRGGYLERLPLALVASGIVDRAEIWHHWRGEGEPSFRRDSPWLARRAFRLDQEEPPFASREMVEFVEHFGAPHILVVLGLGVATDLLETCADSVIIYNSIDAPALRVPPAVSAHFDLVLTGAEWQSSVVAERHPDMPTLILPIGPEFAAPEQFYPLRVGFETHADRASLRIMSMAAAA